VENITYILYNPVMKNLIKFKKYKEELLESPDIKEKYDELEEEYNLVEEILRKRIERNMTQKDLARKIGTKQSAIARLESGKYNPTVKFLKKVAKALDSKLRIEFV
jgi:ribosome-binding protein aMBF1 (putative translation factor)